MKYMPLLACFFTPIASATVACNGFGACGTTYGVLSGIAGNFDIANDTDRPAHGFEIDYEGAYSAQVGYTWTYSRYGAPTITEYKDTAGVNHAVVHYESKKDASGNWVSNTIPLIGTWTTGGHSCTSPVGDTGCEHFVTGMSAGPFGAKSVSYYWLVDDGTGKLIKGTSVGALAPGATMAAPVFQAPAPIQPAPMQPAVMQPAVVQVVPVQPVPKEKVEPAPAQWGEPVWLKVTKTTTHNKKIGKDIGDAVKALVNEDNDGDNLPDWQNKQEAQVESEWYLIQKPPVGKNGGAKEAHVGAAEQVGNDETITRKYEWFANVAPTGANGSFDGETHEQMCDAVGPDGIHGSQTAVTITDPNGDSYVFDCSKVAIVGNYLAGNMVAFADVMPLTQLEALPDMPVNKAMAKRTTIFGGNAPYQVTTDGNVPAGISFEADTGIMSGTPTVPGLYTFNVHATDVDGTVVSKSYTFDVLQANGQPVPPVVVVPVVPVVIDTSILTNGVEGLVYPDTQIVVSGGTAPYAITLDPASVLPEGIIFDGVSLSGTPVAPNNAIGAQGSSGVYALTFNVTDAKGASTSSTLSLTIDTPSCSGVQEKILGFTQLRINPAFTTATNGVRYSNAATTINAGATFAVGELATYEGSRDPSGVFCEAATIIIDPAPVAPTATPVPATATPVPTAVPTATPVPTAVPTATPVPTAIPTATPAPTAVPTATPVPTAVPTPVPASCAIPSGAKSATVNAKVTAVNGSQVTIGSKVFTIADCAAITYAGHATSIQVGYKVEVSKGYVLNGANIAVKLTVDDGK